MINEIVEFINTEKEIFIFFTLIILLIIGNKIRNKIILKRRERKMEKANKKIEQEKIIPIQTQNIKKEEYVEQFKPINNVVSQQDNFENMFSDINIKKDEFFEVSEITKKVGMLTEDMAKNEHDLEKDMKTDLKLLKEKHEKVMDTKKLIKDYGLKLHKLYEKYKVRDNQLKNIIETMEGLVEKEHQSSINKL